MRETIKRDKVPASDEVLKHIYRLTHPLEEQESKMATAEEPLKEVEGDFEELARRRNDGLEVSLRTLGGAVLTDTPAIVRVSHRNGVKFKESGQLIKMADIFIHPMVYVFDKDAKTAFPPRQNAA